MAAVKEIVALLVLAVLCLTEAAPTPGHSKHEKYIIHVPIKFHTIHHVKIEKVPIHVKKHIHHHKYEDHEPQVNEGHGGYDRYDEFEDNGSYENAAYDSYEGSNEYHH